MLLKKMCLSHVNGHMSLGSMYILKWYEHSKIKTIHQWMKEKITRGKDHERYKKDYAPVVRNSLEIAILVLLRGITIVGMTISS